MKSSPIRLTYEIELDSDERLTLPESLLNQIGKGRWLITIEPYEEAYPLSIRDHTAFLNSYVREDEGLYDDCPSR